MNASKSLIFCLTVFLGVSSYAKAVSLPEPLYVSPGTNGHCTSWTDACEFQTAMVKANSGDEVWVAAGTYKPTTDHFDPLATFQLKSGVAIYGGFFGEEVTRDERNWVKNLTTLSGDIGVVGDIGDNSYHVVTGSGVDATAVLDGFTISCGNADGTEPHNYGGGMYNASGHPTLTNVTFSANSATYYGGGMYNYFSNPALTNLTFTSNSVGKYGGGMYNDYGSPALTNVAFTENSATIYGGGMVNWSSNPTLTNVTFTENSGIIVGGGMYNFESAPTLTNVTFAGNTASDYGGGMVNWSSSSSLTDVTFSNNTASTHGGGMVNGLQSYPTLTNVTFAGNTASDNGGGMVNWSSSPSLTDVTFSNNTASTHGGGMYNGLQSNPTLTDVTFTTNSADVGGGMFNSNSGPTLTNVTFSNNIASTYGGGLYNYNYSGPTLTNVTFTENSATNSGGGMYNYNYSSPALVNVTFSNNTASTLGGGMFNYEYSSPTLANVTFSNNTASTHGGGMFNDLFSSPTVTNAILWGNTPNQIYNAGSSAIVTYSDIQGGYPGGNIDSDPFLLPLANNGGFTQTHALLSGSPAIDTANPAFCPTYDQRGYPRPIDGNGDDSPVCDMGAYEFGSSVDGFALTVEIVGSGVVAKNPEELKYPLGEVVNLTATANPGWTFSSWGGDASGTINPLPVTMSRHKSITANFTRIYKLYLPLILRN